MYIGYRENLVSNSNPFQCFFFFFCLVRFTRSIVPIYNDGTGERGFREDEIQRSLNRSACLVERTVVIDSRHAESNYSLWCTSGVSNQFDRPHLYEFQTPPARYLATVLCDARSAAQYRMINPIFQFFFRVQFTVQTIFFRRLLHACTHTDRPRRSRQSWVFRTTVPVTVVNSSGRKTDMIVHDRHSANQADRRALAKRGPEKMSPVRRRNTTDVNDYFWTFPPVVVEWRRRRRRRPWRQ